MLFCLPVVIYVDVCSAKDLSKVCMYVLMVPHVDASFSLPKSSKSTILKSPWSSYDYTLTTHSTVCP